DGFSQLSAYERKRLKNITENAKFFASLKLHEPSGAPLPRRGRRCRPKPPKAREETVRRRSMRLQRAEPSAAPAPAPPAQPEPQEHPLVPPGPLPMLPEDQKENSRVTEEFLTMWTRIIPGIFLALRYLASLSSMALGEDGIRKVVKARVCSMAIHPAESALFVAAGDKLGQIGLWNLDCKTEEGTHVFIPHNYPVSCMHFSPANPAHLVSLSYDSLRRGDVTRAVFDEICRSEESFSSFDFLDENASSVIVGHWDGDVAVVDVRTPGTSSELSANIGFKRTRTVHVHPVNKQYFVAAGSLDVCIYDVRYLRASGSAPVSSLEGHSKSVASAYFSPATGSRVVTVCADDRLRHNNNTGRWLTRFRAIWDPKQEDCFVVGSMARPRQIEVFRDTGKLLHSFYNVDYLGSVCSINVVHPTKNILVGGNSSGRLHVF
ncbi:WDR76 protein, partial [Eudromia elegans]|nr:WDR76 protein [Eudromia elegans]